MREIFTYGSVGGAPGNRCFYPELLVKLRPIECLSRKKEKGIKESCA
jgi:hypothetical protein